MLTASDKAKLLRTPCPWCGAGPGSLCRVRALIGKRAGRHGDNRVHSLEGGCHDARWQAALGRPAPVVVDRLPECRTVRRASTAYADRPGTVGVLDPSTTEAPNERPW